MGSPPGPPSSLRSGLPSVLGTRRVLSWSPGRDLRGPGTQQAVLWGVRYWPLAHLTHLAAPCERETKLETTDPGRAGPVKSTGSRQRPGGHQALSRTAPGKHPGLQEGASRWARRRRGSKGTDSREFSLVHGTGLWDFNSFIRDQTHTPTPALAVTAQSPHHGITREFPRRFSKKVLGSQGENAVASAVGPQEPRDSHPAARRGPQQP